MRERRKVPRSDNGQGRSDVRTQNKERARGKKCDGWKERSAGKGMGKELPIGKEREHTREREMCGGIKRLEDYDNGRSDEIYEENESKQRR